MSHLITCPDCSKHLQVPEELIGRKVQCPECKQTFTAAVTEDQEPIKSKKPDEPDEPDAWGKKNTRVGVSKKTNRRSDDEDDDDDDDDNDYGRRRRNNDDDDEDGDEDFDVRRRPRSPRSDDNKPSHVTGIGIMALVGGIWACLLFLIIGGGSSGICCLWPGTYYTLVVGILAIVKGSSVLGSSAYLNRPPTGIAIMMIINIINGDLLNLVLGILILVFCADEEVKSYFAQ